MNKRHIYKNLDRFELHQLSYILLNNYDIQS